MKKIEKLDSIKKRHYYTTPTFFCGGKKRTRLRKNDTSCIDFSSRRVEKKNINYEDNKTLDQIILNLKNLYEDKWKIINKINTSITIPVKISIKNSNFITSDKLENILNQSDFVYEYEIEKMNSEEIIYKIIYNNNPEKFLNTLKVNDININSSSDIWYIE